MNISGILAITGKPGLYKIVSQTKNGLLVESLDDGKRFPVFSSDKVSTLEDISLYTSGEDMPLKEVLEKIYEKTAGKEAISPKSSPEELSTFLTSVVPYDKDRVYASDIKKLIQWFNTLLAKGLLSPDAESENENAEKVDAKKVAPKKETLKKPGSSSASQGGAKASAAKKGGAGKSVTPRKAG